ncbi:MAG: HAD family hydrolase [Clostridia bacterium]|nr:HAD family hydrolase [Clostridia bacterium]
MEILNSFSLSRVKAVLFDFDGTISTLRCGWEEVMAPIMVEKLLACGRESAEECTRLVNAYIDESTGIQTIFQMKWLSEQVTLRGGPKVDPWDYKAEYNDKLLRRIEEKKRAVRRGLEPAARYLMCGATDFLKLLKSEGVHTYVASGTDHPDMVAEAKALGVFDYFDELMGAPVHEENCSKEAVLKKLIEKNKLTGDDIAVIGDGKVEIRLGKQAGARTLGLAGDERARHGVNPAKRARLINAGADAICGDFTETNELKWFLGLGQEA